MDIADERNSACSSAKLNAGLKARAAHTGHITRGLPRKNFNVSFLRYRVPAASGHGLDIDIANTASLKQLEYIGGQVNE